MCIFCWRQNSYVTLLVCVSPRELKISNSTTKKLKLTSKDRLVMEDKIRATEIMQKTRIELVNGDISDEEVDASIRVSTSINIKMVDVAGGL